MAERFLISAINQFAFYKSLAEKAMIQLSDEQLFYQSNDSSNSIAQLISHLSGNMISRWTDFLTSDGEKDWRNRDAEFESKQHLTRVDLMNEWERGWSVLFSALDNLSDEDLQRTVYIRNEPHLVMQAIIRQLTHYAYHVGQIVYISKMLLDKQFQCLSIPVGELKV